MIHLDLREAALTPEEDFGVSVLIDLARLLPVEDPSATVVRLVPQADGATTPGPEALNRAIQVQDRAVVVPRSLLRAAARLVSAAAEQGSLAADRLGRVPSAATPMVEAGLSSHPVVSTAAVRLREAVVRAAAGRPVWLLAPWPEGKRWAASLTHDLDLVSGWPAATALRTVEQLRRGALRGVARVLPAALGALGRNPVSAGVERLLQRLARFGVRGTWFVIAGTPTIRSWLRGDVTYRAESPRARKLIGRVLAAGHEVGLHGSFATMTDPGRMAEERERLARVAGRPVAGVRQHFLRSRPGPTQRAMIQAGFSYDATAGYPDRNGFRLGLADAARWWDAGSRHPTGLEQVPLTWMDRAQSKYGGEENPAVWVGQGIELARRCQAVEGLWVGLWHPNLTTPLGYPDAEAALEDLLREVLAGGPFVAPLGELVAWRQRRRAARATTVGPDGRPVLVGASGDTVPLEQATPGPTA